MQHTVIGLFETYTQAEGARDTLVRIGLARDTIELQANPEPSVGSATGEVAGGGVLANIERFLSSLFTSSSRADDSARYTEAMRRGAVLVCVHATSEAHAELARDTLVRLGATDIGSHMPDLEGSRTAAASREHSLLDELGIGAMTPGTPHTSSVTTTGVSPGVATGTTAGVATPASTTAPVSAAGTAAPGAMSGMAGADPLNPAAATVTADPYLPPGLNERPRTGSVNEPLNAPLNAPLDEPVIDPLVGDVGRNAIAAGSAPGSGAVMQPSETVSSAPQPAAGMGGQVPNEYMEYEEDFRSHYDEQYATADERYEDYLPAYRYGTEIGSDARFRGRSWEEIEPEARRHWESTSPDSTWERFRVAVRHGWERVTGQRRV